MRRDITGKRPCVALNQKPLPGGVRGFLPQTARGVWLRNQMLRLLPYLPFKDRLGGEIQKSANGIVLKDYSSAESSVAVDALATT